MSGSLISTSDSIEITHMPKTFQDAIIVTRELGLPYLWIDSLCIIQQNKEDWEVESAKMADYYGNATIMLAAANSTADTEGFLRERSYGEERLEPDDPMYTVYVDQCSVFEFDNDLEMRRLYLKRVENAGRSIYSSSSDPVRSQPLQRRAIGQARIEAIAHAWNISRVGDRNKALRLIRPIFGSCEDCGGTSTIEQFCVWVSERNSYLTVVTIYR
ncbi:hypothetical protein BU23DRAFT_562554 [Bimuria novae-zelandiae CBS 107.79]|uniref:Heterokaryon incompatibility domain-containing protein n=1 Tax=Bimuria novae-zelandiae CBS 107.79 TaxID=1447943 RepID=A0A6A5VWK7_9PLEO|nr:hypothetical protein BU23DRAFT_562554 [Bimuria novae-zelandiae CBS 107.79]